MKFDLPSPPTSMPEIYKNGIVIDLLYNTHDHRDFFQLAIDSGLTMMQHSVTSIRAETSQAFKEMAEFHNIVDENSDLVMVATKAEHVRQAKREGKLAVLMGTQNPKFIMDEIHYVRAAYELGLRVLMLTHNDANYIGGGCGERDDGLTNFGKQVIRECNRLGMLIDVAHCGPKTTLQAIEYSDYPIVATHNAPRSLFPSFRNKSDEEIVKLAEKGGVQGILCWSPVLYRDPAQQPTLSDVMDAYDHVISLVGPEHVAIGTDSNENKFISRNRQLFEQEYSREGRQGSVVKHLEWYSPETMYVKGTGSVAQLPDQVQALIDRGHGDDAVRLIMGESSLRLMEQVLG